MTTLRGTTARFAPTFSLLLAASLLAVLPQAYAGDMDCTGSQSADRAGCSALKGIAIGVGAAVVGAMELTSALTPGTDVLVLTPGAAPFAARLTRKGASGRTVKAGDTLALDCKVNETAYPDAYGYASCTLTFPKLTPNPKAGDYYQRQGTQPTWSFGANQRGELAPGILKVDRPVPLSPVQQHSSDS